MKKQNKRKTTSFKSSIILLLLIAVLLVSSTYAWFTANQTVTISSIQVNVQASNGLQISTDAANWKAVISNDDIKTGGYAGNTNSIPASLAPVSTAGEVNAGLLKMFYGTVGTDQADYYIKSVADTDAGGHYIVFDIFLKVDAADGVQTPVYLTTASGVKYAAPATGTTVNGDVGLQNAARVAFIKEGNVTAAAAATATAKLEGTTSSIWEPNYDAHTAAAVTNALNTYGITTQSPLDTTHASSIPYYGLKDVIPTDLKTVLLKQLNTETTNPNATYYTQVTPTYKTKANTGFAANLLFENLDKGITKYRVYMWVEGQDVDCDNSASGTDIAYTLQFSTNA